MWEGSEYVLTPYNNVTLFHSKLLLYNFCKFHIIKNERFASKMEDKSNFQGAYRLSGTGIVECLEITDGECNVKQFDGLT